MAKRKKDLAKTATKFGSWYLNTLAQSISEAVGKKGFWEGANAIPDKVYQCYKIALIHSELGEWTEAIRAKKQRQSEHIPAFTAIEEEAADTIIRILDLCGYYNWDVGGALCAKLLFNQKRPYLHGKRL